MKGGILAPRDPETVADGLGALVHGIVNFEVAGYFDSRQKAEEMLSMAGTAMLRGLGD